LIPPISFKVNTKVDTTDRYVLLLHSLSITERRLKVVKNRKRQEQIIHDCHSGTGASLESTAAAGHFGRDKMVAKIGERWFFPHITARVMDYIKYCHPCQLVNAHKLAKGGETLHSIPVPKKVWSQIGIDIIGKLKESEGCQYIVTAVDYCSKWVEAAPLPNKCGVTVARFLWGLQCRYGAADIHITDQGREFVNQLSAELCRLSGVKQRITSAYHPQANGLVERQNRTTEACILKSCRDRQDQWIYALDSILFACRTSKHASTGFTPYRMMFNRDPVIPAELADNLRDVLPGEDPPLLSQSDKPTMTYEETVEAMEATRQEVLDSAMDNIEKSQAIQTKYYNMRHASEVFPVGTKVSKQNMKDKSRKEKGKDPFLGPYTVMEVNEFGAYKLKDRHGHINKKWVPPAQVTKYNKRMHKGFVEPPQAPTAEYVVHGSQNSQSSQGSQARKRHVSDSSEASTHYSSMPPPKKNRLSRKRGELKSVVSSNIYLITKVGGIKYLIPPIFFLKQLLIDTTDCLCSLL
jgi:hypothetical protein